jgi:translation elongation factor EF-1beta
MLGETIGFGLVNLDLTFEVEELKGEEVESEPGLLISRTLV